MARFEDAVATLALERGVDGVVCGHIHRPEVRTIRVGDRETLYANCGDWVENCTALVEHGDGRLEVVRWTDVLASGDGAARGLEVDLEAVLGVPTPAFG